MNIVKLVNVDFEKRVGTFLMRTENQRKWTAVVVNIDPLLMYRIQHRENDKRLLAHQEYVNCEFESEENSPYYHENPFLLKHFVPGKNSDMVEHYTLDTVDHLTVNLRDQIRKKMVDYEAVSHLLLKFNRKIETFIVNVMSDHTKTQYAPASISKLKI